MSVAEPAASVPYAGRTVIALDPGQFDVVQRTVAALFRVGHSAAYAARVDIDAPAVARFAPGNFGVFMGYDFHLTADGPRLIEVNTNAGGALLNGLHTAALCEPARIACLCDGLLSVDTMEQRILDTFTAELCAVRGADARLQAVAIVDDRPEAQFLREEFSLFQSLFERHRIRCVIGDTSALVRDDTGRLRLDDLAVDLVYLRDTDFLLEAPRSAVLRDAYLSNAVVVTPAPREHHLLANKQRLSIFSDEAQLTTLGVAATDVALLTKVVPETHPLDTFDPGQAWRSRRDLVFKPAAAYGSKAVYRGDKISRRRFDELVAEGGFLAQRRIEPGEVNVETVDGPRNMKFDVRAYAYRDEVLLLGARVYEGQVTNMRSPGGGFSGICVRRAV